MLAGASLRRRRRDPPIKMFRPSWVSNSSGSQTVPGLKRSWVSNGPGSQTFLGLKRSWVSNGSGPAAAGREAPPTLDVVVHGGDCLFVRAALRRLDTAGRRSAARKRLLFTRLTTGGSSESASELKMCLFGPGPSLSGAAGFFSVLSNKKNNNKLRLSCL